MTEREREVQCESVHVNKKTHTHSNQPHVNSQGCGRTVRAVAQARERDREREIARPRKAADTSEVVSWGKIARRTWKDTGARAAVALTQHHDGAREGREREMPLTICCHELAELLLCLGLDPSALPTLCEYREAEPRHVSEGVGEGETVTAQWMKMKMASSTRGKKIKCGKERERGDWSHLRRIPRRRLWRWTWPACR